MIRSKNVFIKEKDTGYSRINTDSFSFNKTAPAIIGRKLIFNGNFILSKLKGN